MQLYKKLVLLIAEILSALKVDRHFQSTKTNKFADIVARRGHNFTRNAVQLEVCSFCGEEER